MKQSITVEDQSISVILVDGKEYISLTNLARYADKEEPKFPIHNWMRNKDIILYLGLWEKINNNNFKGVEFDTFKNEAARREIEILSNNRNIIRLDKINNMLENSNI